MALLGITDSIQLIEHFSGAWRISEETQHSIFTESATHRPIPRESAGRSSTVGISTVSTFIARKSFLNFAVPPFAAHWGVTIEFNPRSTILYHLLFDVDTRKVRLALTAWDPNLSKHNITQVGTTVYGAAEAHLIGYDSEFILSNDIGEHLLDEFKKLGSYHFIFWNCQLFAKIFLKLICQDPETIDFGALTSAQVTRFVCHLPSMLIHRRSVQL